MAQQDWAQYFAEIDKVKRKVAISRKRTVAALAVWERRHENEQFKGRKMRKMRKQRAAYRREGIGA